MALSAEQKLLTGLAGEFYIAAELCRRGYFASLTLKNYPKVDIFAFDPTTQQQVPIQVKAIRGGLTKWRYFVPKDAGTYAGLFAFVVVHDDPTPGYTVCFLSGPEVATLSQESRKDYASKHPGLKLEDLPLMLSDEELMLHKDNWHVLSRLFSASMDSTAPLTGRAAALVDAATVLEAAPRPLP